MQFQTYKNLTFRPPFDRQVDHEPEMSTTWDQLVLRISNTKNEYEMRPKHTHIPYSKWVQNESTNYSQFCTCENEYKNET